MNSLRLSFSVLFTIFSFQAFSYSNMNDFENNDSQLKAVVFLSAFCPCSQSHVDHLNEIQQAYKNLKIFGVVTDEFNPKTQAKIDEYFNEDRFNFSIVKDVEQKLVKNYNALKTPHIVLLEKIKAGKYKRIYEGGVTDQRQFGRSKKKFLQENLVAYRSGNTLPYSKGQSLGCYIRRF